MTRFEATWESSQQYNCPQWFDWDLGTLGALVFHVGCAFALINKEKEYGTLTYCMG